MKIFQEADIANEGVEAYLTATAIALTRKEIKRARRYLEMSYPLLDNAARHIQLLWQSYEMHPLLQKDKQQYENALAVNEQLIHDWQNLGATQSRLTVSLFGADLAAMLGSKQRDRQP